MSPDNQNQSSTNIYDKVIAGLGTIYRDTIRHRMLLIVITVVITGALVFINSRKGNTYSSSFTVVYDELVRKIYGDRLVKLDMLLKNNTEKAQELMDISDSAVSALKEIRPTNILGEDLTKDMNTDKIPFVVHMQLDDTLHLNEIQEGIIHYLETGNEYLIVKRRLRKQEIEDELNFINQQLALMDTLKTVQYTNSGSMMDSEKDSKKSSASESSVYLVAYDLYKKKQELMKKKEMPQNLYVIDDALVPVKNSKPYLLVIIFGLAISFVVYLLIAYLVLPVMRYKKP